MMADNMSGMSAENLEALLADAVAAKLTYRELYLEALALVAAVTRERDAAKCHVRELVTENRKAREALRVPFAEKVA